MIAWEQVEKRHKDQALRNFNIRKLGREGERTGKWEAKMVRGNQGSIVSWQPKGVFQERKSSQPYYSFNCAAERSWKISTVSLVLATKRSLGDLSESSVCVGGIGQLWTSTVGWQVNGSLGVRERYYRQCFCEVWLWMGEKKTGRRWRGIWSPGKFSFFNGYFSFNDTFYFERYEKKSRKAKQII